MCHDILIFGISSIKWRQSSDMTMTVDWDVKPQIKLTNRCVSFVISDQIYQKEKISQIHWHHS